MSKNLRLDDEAQEEIDHAIVSWRSFSCNCEREWSGRCTKARHQHTDHAMLTCLVSSRGFRRGRPRRHHVSANHSSAFESARYVFFHEPRDSAGLQVSKSSPIPLKPFAIVKL